MTEFEFGTPVEIQSTVGQYGNRLTLTNLESPEDGHYVRLTVKNAVDHRFETVHVTVADLLDAIGYEDTTEEEPEQPRFAKGDRVVIQPNPLYPEGSTHRVASRRVGEVGEAEGLRPSPDGDGVWVRVDGVGYSFLLSTDSVAPYTAPEALADWERDLLGLDEPTIKVGGVYRVKDDPHFTAGASLQPCTLPGSRSPGTVVRVVGTCGDGDLRVSRDDSPGGPIHPDYLEPVGEPRVGDFVQVTGPEAAPYFPHEFVGKRGKVMRVDQDAPLRYAVGWDLESDSADVCFAASEIKVVP